MEMPSDTLIVLNTTPLPPAASADFAASFANPSMCILHGVTMLQVDADLWFPEIVFGEADGTKHCPARCVFIAVDDDAGVAA